MCRNRRGLESPVVSEKVVIHIIEDQQSKTKNIYGYSLIPSREEHDQTTYEKSIVSQHKEFFEEYIDNSTNTYYYRKIS